MYTHVSDVPCLPLASYRAALDGEAHVSPEAFQACARAIVAAYRDHYAACGLTVNQADEDAGDFILTVLDNVPAPIKDAAGFVSSPEGYLDPAIDGLRFGVTDATDEQERISTEMAREMTSRYATYAHRSREQRDALNAFVANRALDGCLTALDQIGEDFTALTHEPAFIELRAYFVEATNDRRNAIQDEFHAHMRPFQDAADELSLFADNTEPLYARRLKRQSRLRDALKANPAAPYGTVTYVIYAHYALSRYIAEIGHKPAGWSPAAINCFAQDAEEQDRDELKYDPFAFDWITPEAVARHEQSR